MANKLKAHLASGKLAINAWSSLPSTYVAECMAQSDWDSITYDLQHGIHDYASAVACIQACQAYAPTPLVRVPWNEPGILGKALDAGAWGVIIPMINTVEDARAVATACLYPPDGTRSNGPIRAAAYGGAAPYQSIANDEILILPQVETRQAVENVDAILDVKGISGFYVGPSDLGFSYGLAPILDREEPQIIDIYGRLVDAARKRGLIAGIHTVTPDYGARMARMGFRFITVGSDRHFVDAGSREALAATRKAIGG